LTARGPMQMGHWKQLRVHLGKACLRQQCSRAHSRKGAMDSPVAFALDVAARHLKQTAWTVVCDNLLGDTAGASYLVTVFAVEEVLEAVETVVGSCGSGIEGAVVVVGVGARLVRTRTLDVGVRGQGRHDGHLMLRLFATILQGPCVVLMLVQWCCRGVLSCET